MPNRPLHSPRPAHRRHARANKLARDRRIGRLVALKFIGDASPERLYRFKREFRTLSAIVHPNLVELYELLQAKGDDGSVTFLFTVTRGGLLDTPGSASDLPQPRHVSASDSYIRVVSNWCPSSIATRHSRPAR